MPRVASNRQARCTSDLPLPPCFLKNLMDIEQINLIGTTLTDLTERTQELRRYL